MAVVEVVKYDGNPDVFAWKFPNSELGTWTQLIVNETQEAILLKGGIICDVFQAGRHTLDTANIPVLNKIINIPFGGKSPFSAEVWYINRVFSLDIKWGTPSPIQLQDPKYKLFIPVRAFGQFGVQVNDSKKFLFKLVGTLPRFDKATLLRFFKGIYLTKVKDVISSYLVHKNISILEINAYLDEISTYLRERISPIFDAYGIRLVSFYVNDISVPDDDNSVIQLKNALAKRAEMDIVGYSYQQERSFDTLEGAAKNSNSMQGNLMGAGIGLGMGVSAGGTIGHQFGGLAQSISTSERKECPKCKAMIDKNEKFCHVCGYNTEQPVASKEQKEDIKCSECGRVLSVDSKFCPECGKRYNPCKKCKADVPVNAMTCPSCGMEVTILCPKCGAQLPIKNKFCPECGHSLIKRCNKCGTQLNGTPKFCPECGSLTGGEHDGK